MTGDRREPDEGASGDEAPPDEGASGDEARPVDQREPPDGRRDGDVGAVTDDGSSIAGLGGVSGPWTPSFLTDIRQRPRRRAVALIAAVLAGVAAAWVHWIGLFVAGALVGLASRTVPRALLVGVGVGVLVLGVQVLASPVMGAGEFLALTPPAYVAIAAAVALPAWGSLVRGAI